MSSALVEVYGKPVVALSLVPATPTCEGRSIGDVEDLSGIGERDYQRAVAPLSLVGHVHALLALALGLHDTAIGFDAGDFIEKRARLASPDSKARRVDE